MSSPSRPSPIRRIVTGRGPDGKSDVLFDSVDPHKLVISPPGIEDRVLWLADSTPSSIALKDDPVSPQPSIEPPANGSVFRIVDFPPFKRTEVKDDFVRSLVGGEEAAKGAAPHPMMHRTRTLDYAIVLSGEIDMLLESRTVHCKAGDVVIQQGTTHAWVNKGAEVCRVAFIMIDAVEAR